MAVSDGGTKNMTLRLDLELADRVQAIAEVDDITVSQVVRDALVTHVERRRQDPEFQRLLDNNLKRHARLLEMLADG